ncbi:MAG: DUF45 domain-containing protein [Rhodocyclaceae bacterium]|nr:DUF45 domain-containing protein [Rhodocyclaceae bacterium]
MTAALSSRSTKKAPQLALRLGALPDCAIDWCDGVGIVYLGRELRVRLGTAHTVAALEGENLHLPLPPEASARQIQDSAEAWLRQQCVAYVETLFAQNQNRQLVLVTRRSPQVLLSFAARAPWISVDDANTVRCNWRLIAQAPQTIAQHADKALRQLSALCQTNTTVDMFGALPA